MLTQKSDDQGLRETSQERVAIVNARKYKRNKKSFGGVFSEVVVIVCRISRKAVLKMKLTCCFIGKSVGRNGDF